MIAKFLPLCRLAFCLILAIGFYRVGSSHEYPWSTVQGYGRVGSAHRNPGLAAQESPEKPKPADLKLIDFGTKDPRLKGYFLPEGFKLEIVADAPIVGNMVDMQFDERGTLHVVAWVGDGTGGPAPQTKVAVKALHDRHRDGSYDVARTVLESESASKLMFHDGWLYLTDRTALRRYRSTKNDSRYDVQEEIIRGFGESFSPPVTSLALGIDGWLYIVCRDGKQNLVGRDGTAARLSRSGTLLRCRPDGTRLQVIARGFGSGWNSMVFDASLNRFILAGVQSNKQGNALDTHLLHVVEDASYSDRFPGAMPPLVIRDNDAMQGLLIYNDTFLPERFQGLLLTTHLQDRVVRGQRLEPQGASFTVLDEVELLRSNDQDFLPNQMIIGPDGAIYLRAGRTTEPRGRIYRLTWAGTAEEPAIPTRPLDSWHKISSGSDEQVFQALASPNFTDRGVAARELARRGVKQRPALLKVLKDEDASAGSRIAALGALQSLWNEEVQAACLSLLGGPNPDLRRLAGEAIQLEGKMGDATTVEALVKTLSDRDPAVRRVVALALGRMGGPIAADALLNAYRFDDGKDLWLQDGLLRAIERLGPLGMDRLLALAESGRTQDLQLVVRAFAACRTRPAAEALPRLLANPHLTENDQQTLLRSYQNYQLEPPIALEPVVTWLEQHPHATPGSKLAALQSLTQVDGLKGERPAKLLLDFLQAEADEEVRVAAIDIAMKIRLERAGPVLTDMLHHQRSIVERRALLAALAALKVQKAVPQLEALLKEEPWAELHPTLLETLTRIDPAQGTKAAQRCLQHHNRSVVIAAFAVLADTPEGAKALGQAYLDKKLSPDRRLWVIRALQPYSAKHPELARMLEEVTKAQ